MKKGDISFDENEPFFIYVEFFCEVTEDTNNLIVFPNPGSFFQKMSATILRDFFFDKNFIWARMDAIHHIYNRQNYL